MNVIKIDASALKEFSAAIGKAGAGLPKTYEEFLKKVGDDFLGLVRESIMQMPVMDTRNLLHSFTKGSPGGVWALTHGNMTLEIGSVVDYAAYVNDGHWLNPTGVNERFVPGYWKGHHFVYDKSAKGGMMLYQKWIPGKPYFDDAVTVAGWFIREKMYKMLDDWIAKYF
ncbi:MAG: HK97 gp10 family phage protein [Oscillospiraceae bacterium]|jgi:hypothetical protein|nr:HK97 gp10 family phage protein [Oscillospiraceae bacterium]